MTFVLHQTVIFYHLHNYYDTLLYLADSNLATLFKKANEEVNKLYDWSCSNKLSLNPTKTQIIVIKASNTLQNTSGVKRCIANTPLTQIGVNFQEKSTHFLGILIDENWCHGNIIWPISTTKISHALFVLKKAKTIPNTESLKTLYYALI